MHSECALPARQSLPATWFNSAELAVTKDNIDLMVEQMEEVYRRNLHAKPKTEGRNREFFVDNFPAIKKELEQDNYIRAKRCLELRLVDHAELPKRRHVPQRPRRSSEKAAGQAEALMLLLSGLVDSVHKK